MAEEVKTAQKLNRKSAGTKVTYGPAVSKAPDEENIDTAMMLPTGKLLIGL